MSTPTARHPFPDLTGDGMQNPTPAPPIEPGDGDHEHDALNGLPVAAAVPDMGQQDDAQEDTAKEIAEESLHPGTPLQLLTQSGQLDRIEAELAAIRFLLATETQPDELRFATLVSGKELIIRHYGRKYFYVLSGGIIACNASVMGISVPFTLRPGFNLLPFPDGTGLTTITGSQVVGIKRTNTLIPDGASLTNPAGVAVALASTAPTATNSGSDTSIPFASTVQHWTLQNNSAANLYYNLDAAATTGSLVLPPGAQVFYDWPVTSVHVYTASAININSVGGLALVGRV